MSKFFQQLRLLLWKNWNLRKRHKTRVFMELVWPLILFLILMWVRTKGLKVHHSSCHIVEKALPSVGGFEFFQNFVCTLNNTCYDDYVENEGQKMWENALGTKFVKEVAPLMQEILENPKSIETLGKLWSDITTYLKLIAAFREAKLPVGKVKLNDLMEPEGRNGFLETAPGYSGATEEQLVQLLDSEINLDAVTQKSVDQIIDDFKSGKCNPLKEYDLIKLEPKLHRELCQLGRQRAFMLLFVFNNFLDKRGLANRLRVNLSAEDLVRQSSGPNFLEYDVKTLATLGKLFSSVQNFQSFSEKLATNETGISAALVYEAMCGVRFKGNTSTFGASADSLNRYDSLRDRLRDWNSDHRYELDPEISATCNTIFKRLESRAFTALLWRQIKPFIRGDIYYTPDTMVTREIMSGVEDKFSKLKDFEVGLNSLVSVLHRTRKWLRNNSDDIESTKEVLSDPKNLQRLVELTGQTVDEDVLDRLNVFVGQVNITDLDVILQRVDYISEILSEIMTCIKYNKTQGFETEWEAVNAGIKQLPTDKLWAVVVFTNINESDIMPNHIHYKIRMDSDKVDSTRSSRDRLTSRMPRRRPIFDLKYITNGFAYLQEMIEHTIIEMVAGEVPQGLTTYLQQFPYPCYIYDQFIRAISRTFPLFMVLSWVYASSMIVKSIVLEKELKLKEVMKVMGLGNGVIWTGWFFDNFIIMSISATILSLILKFGKVIEHSDFFLIWVFMISFTIATIFFSFLVSTFFTRANSAAAAGGILFFVTYLPYNFLLIWEERLTWYHMLFGSLISNVAFGFGCTYFARFEEDGIGAQWDKITMRTLPDDDFNLSYCILMLWFDSFLYWILTWYIEAVFPGESGMPKPWNFAFKKSYWFHETPSPNLNSAQYHSVPSNSPAEDTSTGIEPEPEGLTKGVVVSNLCKTYSNGRVALTDLNITFYESQICSFLGHNGAGKSTTISILTGLFPSTSGTATVYGKDIHSEMDSIRCNLGICPQFNVLFDRLTVEEHMQFYGCLKGRSKASLNDEVVSMLEDLGIPEKKHEFPKNLSGGMKRKLSVAVAFVGGSKTVFLDEPTAGVDPFSRRGIWELLLKYKEGRTIVLTTHFMDEADLLGDRIAIISQGKLKACGTGLFLKAHFGQGYSLRLVREETERLNFNQHPDIAEDGTNNLQQNSLKSSKAVNIQRFVRLRIPEAILVDDVGSEVVLLLPYVSVKEFPILFTDLDDNLTELGVSSYGISDTTLEDVFLKITFDDLIESENSFHALSSGCKRRFLNLMGHIKTSKKPNMGPITVVSAVPPVTIVQNGVHTINMTDNNTTNGNITDTYLPNGNINNCVGNEEEAPAVIVEHGVVEDELPIGNPYKRKTGFYYTFFVQIHMIILKRFRNSRRNIKAMFFEIMLPAVFIALTLAFTLVLPPSTDEPSREITPWTYPSPNNIFFSEPLSKRNRTSEFAPIVDELIGPIGMGTACLKDQKYHELCPSKSSDAVARAVAEFKTSRSSYVSDVKNCTCELGSMQCPSNVEGTKPPNIQTPTNDVIMDVSQLNIPGWLTKTYRMYDAKRYGGFEFQKRKPPDIDLTEFVFLVDSFSKLQGLPNGTTKKQWGITKPKKVLANKVWYENRGWVSSVAYLNALHNLILRESLPANQTDVKDEFGITLHNHPLNLTISQQKKESLKVAGLGVVHAVCIIFALSFVPASFTVYLIEERKCGGKHLHLVSGVKPVTYWTANFMFDMIKYTVPAILCLILFKLFEARAYVSSVSIGSFITLLFLYGWSSIPLMYPASYLFGVPSTAFVVLACTNLFVGVVTTVSTFVLEQFGDPELEEIGVILKKVFLVFPQYCLGRGLMELVSLDLVETAAHQISLHTVQKNRFDWDHLGKMLFFLFIQGVLFFLINLTCEYKQMCYAVCRRRRINTKGTNEADDEDVQQEAKRVLQNPLAESTILVENLTKSYRRMKYPAVNSLSFAVQKGECFGLLGVNGAGKTSTFKMLTGDVRISGGHARICNHDVETSLDTAREHFGYCPQEDGLDPLLNAYEQLELYGRLRGMSAEDTEHAVTKLIKALGLTRYASKQCGTYSGGNKRKMSTAIALIGDPDVVFFDEPTTGMDPGARRQLWKIIVRLIHLQKSVVLTSHSMEECEALCTKLAIMVNGKFMCFGSLQHLKNRFGTGYTLTVRCAKEVQETFLKHINEVLPSAKLEDSHCSQMKFKIPQQEVKLREVFNVMYDAKVSSLIEDYSVSQTTLDDIFVKFANKQKDDKDR